MKLHHAAALALVGWYLMIPPRVVDRFYPDAPLSKWHRFGTKEYSTKAECESAIEAQKAEFNYDPETLPPEKFTARTLARGARALRCISSDDPRLKGN
jgi:hypothetical protein